MVGTKYRCDLCSTIAASQESRALPALASSDAPVVHGRPVSRRAVGTWLAGAVTVPSLLLTGHTAIAAVVMVMLALAMTYVGMAGPAGPPARALPRAELRKPLPRST